MPQSLYFPPGCDMSCYRTGLGHCIGHTPHACCTWYHENRCVRNCPLPYYVPNTATYECEGRGKYYNGNTTLCHGKTTNHVGVLNIIPWGAALTPYGVVVGYRSEEQGDAP